MIAHRAGAVRAAAQEMGDDLPVFPAAPGERRESLDRLGAQVVHRMHAAQDKAGASGRSPRVTRVPGIQEIDPKSTNPEPFGASVVIEKGVSGN